MKTYPFSALLSRMKYITRWSLMRSTRAESLSEHTADTALLAHTLCQAETQAWLTGSLLNDAERKIVKAADRLSALIKCMEERQSGSHEFEAAEAQQLAALHEMHCPEAEYFIEHMLPCFAQNLDELTRGRF